MGGVFGNAHEWRWTRALCQRWEETLRVCRSSRPGPGRGPGIPRSTVSDAFGLCTQCPVATVATAAHATTRRERAAPRASPCLQCTLYATTTDRLGVGVYILKCPEPLSRHRPDHPHSTRGLMVPYTHQQSMHAWCPPQLVRVERLRSIARGKPVRGRGPRNRPKGRNDRRPAKERMPHVGHEVCR